MKKQLQIPNRLNLSLALRLAVIVAFFLTVYSPKYCFSQSIREFLPSSGTWHWDQNVWNGSPPDQPNEIARIDSIFAEVVIDRSVGAITNIHSLQLWSGTLTIADDVNLRLVGPGSEVFPQGTINLVSTAPGRRGGRLDGDGGFVNYGLIRGQGTVSAGFTNERLNGFVSGEIIADTPGLLSIIGGEKINRSLMEARSGGVLSITASEITNHGGLIISDGGEVRLATTIVGGTLRGSDFVINGASQFRQPLLLDGRFEVRDELDINLASSRTYNANFAGNGSLKKTGLGTVTLDHQGSDFTGVFSVDEGTGRLVDDSLANASEISVANAATVDFRQSSNGVRVQDGLVSGSGRLRLTGSGTVEFDNQASQFSGRLVVDLGAARLRNRSLTLASDFEIASGAVLEFEQTGNSRIENGGFSGSGTIRKAGPGYTFIRNDSNTVGFTGTVDVQQGTLQLDEGKFINANSMTVTNGAAVEMRGRAKWSNSLTVNGSGSFLTAAERLTIDSNTSNSTAGLSLLNGASGGIESLTVGDSQFGQLLVSSGSHISSFRSYLGIGETSSGLATISGIGSQWNHSDLLSVGYGGQATLTIDAGGVVNNTVGYLGNLANSNGIATVTGSGSQWNNSNALFVGSGGTGTLDITAGGLVSNIDGVVGRNAGSNGTVNVYGSGSEWNNSGGLYVGLDGEGTLNVSGGGNVYSTSGFIARDAGSLGNARVTDAGSRWNNSGDLFLGGDTSAAGGTGSLEILDSGLVTIGGTTKLWDTGTLTLDGGTLKTSLLDVQQGSFAFLDGGLAAEQILGDLTQDGGILAAGNSPGLMTIAGDYTANGGWLEVELAGMTAGSEFDFYQVTGDVNLVGGDLQAVLLDGFGLQEGQEFLFMQIDGALTGTFANYSEGDLVLANNGNGLYISYAAGDGNDVGFFVTAVPEPSALIPLALAGFLSFTRRRRA